MGKRVGELKTLSALFLALIFLASTAAGAAADDKNAAKADKPISQVPWKKVSSAEREVLKPLEKDWDQLPGTQQRRLIVAGKQYPKLLPIQQERFQARIKEWAALTPEQRMAAREKYRDLSNCIKKLIHF